MHGLGCLVHVTSRSCLRNLPALHIEQRNDGWDLLRQGEHGADVQGQLSVRHVERGPTQHSERQEGVSRGARVNMANVDDAFLHIRGARMKADGAMSTRRSG